LPNCPGCGAPSGACACAAWTHLAEINRNSAGQAVRVSLSSSQTDGSAYYTKEGGETRDRLGDVLTPKGVDGQPLSDEEQREVKELKKRDRKVKAHEQAHMAAGAGVVRGTAQYEYKKGPDGISYAVGGEVSVDTSEASTPEATVTKMEKVKAAALAPVDPSPQDRRIAAEASVKAVEARAEVAQEKKAEKSESAPREDGAPGESLKTPEHDKGQNKALETTKGPNSNLLHPRGSLVDISI